MRVTNNMMISNMMRNMNKNMRGLDKRQMQVSTGKKFHVPSDDPVAISRSMKIKADLGELEQFKKNVDDATSFLETTELAVKDAGNALTRLRELIGQAANSVLTGEDLLKIKGEVKEIKEQIISLGNTTYAGKYIFSGKKTDQKLFDAEGKYLIDLIDMHDPGLVDHKIKFEIGVNETIEINSLGFEVFDNLPLGGDRSVDAGDTAGVISMINSIINNLDNEEFAQLTGALDDIDKFIDVNLTARSEIGAKVNRMDLVRSRIADTNVNFKSLQSQLEDADMGEVIMQLLNEENVYRASLSVGARIIQPTLMDFLR